MQLAQRGSAQVAGVVRLDEAAGKPDFACVAAQVGGPLHEQDARLRAGDDGDHDGRPADGRVGRGGGHGSLVRRAAPRGFYCEMTIEELPVMVVVQFSG